MPRQRRQRQVSSKLKKIQMEGGGDVSTIGSSADKVEMEARNLSNTTGDGGNNDAPNRISSTGADDESENDELTIDDSCVNDEDMDEDNDNNVAIVSSSTLHQINEEDEEDHALVTSAEPEAVSVTSKPLHIDEDDPMGNDDNDNYASEQSMVSTTTTSETVSQNVGITVTTQIQAPSEGTDHEVIKASSTRGNEDDDVDIDTIEETPEEKEKTDHPASPDGPESPPIETGPVPDNSNAPASPEMTIVKGSNDESIGSPPPPPSKSLEKEDVDKSTSPSSPKPEHNSARLSSQTSEIISQENFSQLETSSVSLSTITSQSSGPPVSSASQESKSGNEECTLDEDTLDGSQVKATSQSGNSPSASEMENDESQQSSIAPPSERSVSNGNAPKSRSKSRSRSNTDDQDDDVDLEDGEIMDDDEEDVKAPPAPIVQTSKDKKEKEKSSSKTQSSSSATKERPSSEKEKEKGARDKDKEKERDKEKDKHRKDKKRSKRDEEKEKEKESTRKNKKRKASDAGESEQEEYLFVRGASPGSAAPPNSDPWSAPVEEFGDDSKVSRAKRRRESDGDASPPNHHHHAGTRPPREPSPVRRGGMDNNRNKRPGRDERKEPKSDVICAYFMQGKCQKSAMECSFSHDAVPPRKMELCKFWMMECCAKKEKCLYLHNDFPCKFYHTGLICKAGDRCKFSHSPLSEITKQVLLKHIETAPKEILGDFPRLNRQGAINLINKMEARMRGEKVDDDKDGFGEMNPMDHHGRGPIPPPHERHHGHGHNRNDDRHARGPRDHHGGHGHGPPHGHHGGHMNQRGNNNDMRGGGGGRGDDRHHQNNNRSSRWEQSHIHPTRDDQEKLHELMQEAGISGFYKDTLETGIQPPVTQPQGPPGSFPPMQPPLLPMNPMLMSQMLPGLMPPGQGNTVNNPALANVLASLNIPSSSIVPPTTTLSASMPQMGTPPVSNPSQVSDDSNLSSDGKTIPEHLPKMQQELFMRIQKQQQKNEKKMQKMEKEPEEQEENWYSSEDEEDTNKKDSGNKSKTEISDKISSVLNQIRAQSQPQTGSSSPSMPSSLPLPPTSDPKPPAFYGDTDFRSQPPSFKDIDLRNPVSMFKKIDIEPAKEINASITHNGPMVYRVRKVAGIRKIDYSSIRMGMPASSILLDPRLGPKRSNSMPAPASPTETSAPDTTVQPLTIPDGTPVFDPRTMRGGASGSARPGPGGIPPQQNNPFLDSDNRFSSLPSLQNPGLSDFPLFNRDPRGLGGGDPRGPNQGGGTGSGNPAQMAAMAAAMAAMQQQLPNMQGQQGMDPNLLMLGFPFLPQQPGSGGGGMDFPQMMPGGGPGGNMRMRPPFGSHQSASSSWERMNQGPQGQGRGDLTPPL